MILKRYNDGKTLGMWCPACQTVHCFNTTWQVTGSDGVPTVTPSLKVTDHQGSVCHFFLTAGQIRYLDDCTHGFASSLVSMQPIPPPYDD